MKTVTFYSYKGGVGRSLTLSNMAKKLVDYGLSVFVIDFDLEAPGLTYKFKDEVKDTDALSKPGIVDYISHFQETRSVPDDFSQFYTQLKPRSEDKGKMYLMTAGQFKKPEYWDKLGKLDWGKLFEEDETGVPLLLDLKGRIKKEVKPEFILIDSRTGVTPTASITLKLLADRCVILAVNNEENLDGAGIVLDSLNSMVEEIKPELFFALTRIPYHNDSEEDLVKENQLRLRISQKFDTTVGADCFKHFAVIHHEREQGWKEEHRLGLKEEKENFLTLDYLNLFENLFPEAIETFSKEKKLKKEKTIVELHTLAIYSNDHRKQIELFSKIIDLVPNEASAYNNRGSIYFNLKKYDLALDDFEKCLELEPDDSVFLSNRGLSFYELGEFDKAFEDFNRSIEINGKDSSVFSNRSLIHLGREDLVLAMQDLEKALELNENNEFALNNRANLLRKIGDPEAALIDIKKALSINSKNAYFHSTLGEINLALMDKENFYANMEKAVKIGFPLFVEYPRDSIYHQVKNEKRFLDLVEKSKSNSQST